MRLPDLSLENAVWAEGHKLVAGIDEAGRGAWAGPVAAAAVILPAGCPDLQQRLDGVRDSKTLSAAQRDVLFEVIQREAVAVGVAMVGPEAVMESGIGAATRRAMGDAVATLPCRPDYLLVDYLRLPGVNLPQGNITRGDQRSLSIAAASIIAKVSRHRLMKQLAADYPDYGFERHKGYGTRVHWDALRRHGATAVHRRTWAPIQKLLAATQTLGGGPA